MDLTLIPFNAVHKERFEGRHILMNEEIKTLISYRIERAFESLAEAEVLLEKGFGNTFVNRLYYACFYAVSADDTSGIPLYAGKCGWNE